MAGQTHLRATLSDLIVWTNYKSLHRGLKILGQKIWITQDHPICHCQHWICFGGFNYYNSTQLRFWLIFLDNDDSFRCSLGDISRYWFLDFSCLQLGSAKDLLHKKWLMTDSETKMVQKANTSHSKVKCQAKWVREWNQDRDKKDWQDVCCCDLKM